MPSRHVGNEALDRRAEAAVRDANARMERLRRYENVMRPLVDHAAALTRQAGEVYAEATDRLRQATCAIGSGGLVDADRHMSAYRTMVDRHHRLADELGRVHRRMAETRHEHALGTAAVVLLRPPILRVGER
jgi:hypothetical protein